MREQIKRAARSPKTLHAGVWINAIAAVFGALAANWGGAQAHLPWHWWLIGLAVLAGINVALHHFGRPG